jgi:hypothetical protein
MRVCVGGGGGLATRHTLRRGLRLPLTLSFVRHQHVHADGIPQTPSRPDLGSE